MVLPALLCLPDVAAYREHYERAFVWASPLPTFDGILVSFFPEQFDHAFFRDSSRTAKDKACFDWPRAERMQWISTALGDASAEVYRRVMPGGKRMRIALLVAERYAAIIQMRSSQRARFVTAYVVDSDSALAKMRSNPRWR